MTTSSIAILLISSLFCTGCTVLAIMFKRSTSRKDKLLAEMQAALETLQKGHGHTGENQDSAPAAGIFDDNLRAAELTTRLQQSRLTVQQRGHSAATPERYRYIQTMVEKGMSTAEIASTLFMSLHETTQLVTLIKMAQRQPNTGEEPKPSTEPAAAYRDNTPARAVAVQPQRPVTRGQTPASRVAGGINKSIKLAKWLKRRALSSPCLRQQSGREPPLQPLPQSEARFCHPLPGYT